MKTNKGILIGAAALVVVVGIFALIYTQLIQKPVQGEKEIALDVVLADGSTTTHDLKTSQEYLGGALAEYQLVQGQQGDYGLFIETVNGVTADEAKQEWWCLTKSGEQVNTSADQTPILDGERYELTLMVGW